ncbi:MAG: type II toxin-antitoxin system VapC family toxin [Solirubrobacteraceae bacterium]
MASGPAAEYMLCDTSFVGWSARLAHNPDVVSGWPRATTDRIERAILAISVITLAETRFGFRNARWGATRIEREERRLAGFLQVPLDMKIVDEWARLKHASVRSGWNVGDNTGRARRLGGAGRRGGRWPADRRARRGASRLVRVAEASEDRGRVPALRRTLELTTTWPAARAA